MLCNLRFQLAGLALIALSTASPPALRQQSADGVTVTFTANEGVMIAGGGRKVLIDALFRRYGTYPVAPDSMQAALASARAPFDSVNLILATHHHGDHFHPAPVALHMRANPAAAVLASRQVFDSLRARIPERQLVAPRFLPRTLPLGGRAREVVNGIPVEILRVTHHDLQHFAYIVEVGGRRVLHAGDTDGGPEAFAPFSLDTARIDLALLPAWFITEKGGPEKIERYIKPKHVAAIHLGPEETRVIRAINAAMPRAFVPSRYGEVRGW